MKYYIVLIEYKTDIENIIRVTDEHRAYIKKGYDKGLFLISGPQIPRSGGVVISKCNSKEELEDFFSQDPYFLNSYADYRFIEFDPKSFKPELKDWIE